jgi:hypothetical protein
VPVLAKGKTRTGRLWTYVRDDRRFAGPDPPAAVFFYSPDRGGEHPEQHLACYAGLMQADAYAGFSKLYKTNRTGPIIEDRVGPSASTRGSPRRRSRPRRSGASMFCSPSTARVAVKPQSRLRRAEGAGLDGECAVRAACARSVAAP